MLSTWSENGRRMRRFEDDLVTIGSGDDCTLRITGAASMHGQFDRQPDGWWYVDAGAGPTLLNDHPLHAPRTLLRHDDRLKIAETTLTILEAHGQGKPLPIDGDSSAQGRGDVVRVGRAIDNDVVIDDPDVASYHLEMWRSDKGLVVRDVGDHGRTSVNGESSTQAVVEPESTLQLGSVEQRPSELIDSAANKASRQQPGGPLLVGRRLSRLVSHQRPILREADVTIHESEFLAIAGTSGAGKSTLMKLLNGYDTPSSGELRVAGDHRQTVGYVPQDDILHRELTLRDAVVLSAALRFPPGTPREQIQKRAEELFVQLGLSEQADTRVSSLSGGQRKRASVALELMTAPRLLLLDEPSSGLDPASDHHLMQLLRALADSGYGIALITHSTLDISVCDRVLFVATGGYVVYHGSLDGALSHFEVDSIELVYEKLEEQLNPPEWRRRFETTEEYGKLQSDVEECLKTLSDGATPSAPQRAEAPLRTAWWQFRNASVRYAKTISGDRRNLIFLLAQVPVIVGLSRLIFGGDVLTTRITPAASVGDLLRAPALDGLQLLFLLGATIVWLGTINASREICKESAIWERERHTGFRPLPYLGSKLLVLGALAAIQVAVLVLLVAVLWSLPAGFTTILKLFVVAILIAMAATSMGLLISAVTATPDRAMSIAPIIMIPQLLFAGVMVALSTMGALPRAVSYIVLGRWGFESLSLVTSRKSFVGPDVIGRYGLNTNLVRPMVALAVLWLLFTLATGGALLWRERAGG